MPGGRPTKYNPEMVDKVIPFLSQGYSLMGLAGHLGIALDTLYRWRDEHPEFSDAIKAGQTASGLWWEELARRNAATGEGNATLCVFGLKNRARTEWADVRQLDNVSSDGTMSPKSELTVRIIDTAGDE